MLDKIINNHIIYILKHYIDKWNFVINVKFILRENYMLNATLEKQSVEFDELVKELANRKVTIAENYFNCANNCKIIKKHV